MTSGYYVPQYGGVPRGLDHRRAYVAGGTAMLRQDACTVSGDAVRYRVSARTDDDVSCHDEKPRRQRRGDGDSSRVTVVSLFKREMPVQIAAQDCLDGMSASQAFIDRAIEQTCGVTEGRRYAT